MDKRDDSKRDLPPADAETARRGSKSGRMGPGYPGGGFGHQPADWHGSRDASPAIRGRAHMSGAGDDTAYGRLGPPSGQVPPDPTQRVVQGGVDGGINVDASASGGAHPREGEQNAQIVGGSPDSPIARGAETERDAPGISTDKRSDDSRG